MNSELQREKQIWGGKNQGLLEDVERVASGTDLQHGKHAESEATWPGGCLRRGLAGR